MHRLGPGLLRGMLEQLEQATRDHDAWFDDLIRTLVCRLPPDPRDLAPDAYRRCAFARWYYEKAPAELRSHPAFAAIEVDHRRLHGNAARLLRAVAETDRGEREQYDQLSAGRARLRVEIESLMHDMEAALRNRDTLTGAYGRAELLPELREWLELGRRGVEPCSIAFMDLDNLKSVNDAYGHAAGDRFLVGAVQYLLDHLRPYDKVFRYGGDEFLMSMPGLELATAWNVIERIRAGFERAPLLTDPEGRRIRVTASFGVAQLEPDLPVEDSIDRADKALLVAKAAGRNRAIAWDPTVTTGSITTRVLEDDTAS